MSELDLATLRIRAQNDELSIEEVQQIVIRLRENRTASLKSAAPKAKATEAKPKVSSADLLNSLL
jgi:TATA-box binding protein (TBP) (component of TFIID and TFIIIB)